MNNWCLYICGFKTLPLSLPLQPVSHAQHHLSARNKGRKNKSRSQDQKSEKWAVIKERRKLFYNVVSILVQGCFFFFFKRIFSFSEGKFSQDNVLIRQDRCIDKLCRGSFSKGREKKVVDIFCLGGRKFLNN